MRALAAVLFSLALAPSPAAAEMLTYRGAVGRVAEYRVTVQATGQQTSLGESRPVRVEAEYAVREEVLSCDAEGNLQLQVTGRVVKVKDTTRAFSNQRLDLPPVLLLVSPRGELLGAEALSGETGMRERAAAELLPQFLPVLLPTGPVEPGQTWEGESQGVKQTNRLLEVKAGRARIASQVRAPLSFADTSGALGLSTTVTGRQTQTSTLELDLISGLALQHKGNLVLQAGTEVAMETPEGRRRFPLELELRVAFESRLVRLEGRPLASGEGSAQDDG